jgi:hypothetical protein
MITEEIQTIKNKHNGGFKTLCIIYFKNGRFIKSKQMWSSIIITFVLSFILLSLIDSTRILEILNKSILKIVSIIPTILGFTLTGYALLLSFSSSEFMDKITDQNDEGYSFYQHFSSIFAWSIIIQATTLFIAFIISVVSDYNLDCQYAEIINGCVFVIIMFFSLYSLLLVSRLVLNVFSFGQVIQFHYTEKKLASEIDAENHEVTNASVKKKSKSKR